MNELSEFLQKNSALIISILSVLSTSATAILTLIINLRSKRNDYKHDEKLKEYEFAIKVKSAAFEDYMKSVINYAKNRSADNLSEYSKAYGRALIYSSDETIICMDYIDHRLKQDNVDIPNDYLHLLAINAQKDIYQHIQPNQNINGDY